MKTVITLSLFFIFFSFSLSSQEITLSPTVVANSGGYEEKEGYSFSWTIGEAVIHTVENLNENYILTQGFQQPTEFTTSTEEVSLEQLGITVYPNPVKGTLTIQLKNPSKFNLTLQLFDTQGKLLLHQSLDTYSQQLELSKFPGASYYLTFLDMNNRYSTVKIVKMDSN